MDVEGTTSSVAFVKETLFPFARLRLRSFVREHRDEAEVRRQLDAVRAELGAPSPAEEPVVAALLRWMDEDRKVGPLKALQGLIWMEGYERGELRGHVYPEVPAALAAASAAGLKLYVYSSGSVLAQRLLFAHSEHGDLTTLLSGYFDTAMGPKTEAESYLRIAAAVALPPAAILFLSDSVAELNAARAAGMGTACLDRGTSSTPAAHEHPVWPDFGPLRGLIA
jgi:enolase-phosphatase E1